jgi:lipoprotein-anchoring transpeptidase ErfK/SrfK
VNTKKIMLGLSSLVAMAALAACSSGQPTAQGGPMVATASSTASSSTAATTTAPPAPTSVAPPAPTTTKPPVATPAAVVIPPGVPCTVEVSACVSISKQEAWLIDDGKVVYGPVPVKTGRTGYPTPVGTFHVQYRQKLHISKEFNDTPMPNSVFFTNGVAFHEGSLSVHSHGCVHLSATSSLKFYDTLRVGDTVQVVR